MMNCDLATSYGNLELPEDIYYIHACIKNIHTTLTLSDTILDIYVSRITAKGFFIIKNIYIM